MIERDEKLGTHARDNPTQPDPTSRKTQPPGNKNTKEFTNPAKSGTPKKVNPEEWQGGQPTDRQDEPQTDEEDVDEIEENEPEEPTV